AAREEVERLLDRLGWATSQELGSLSPAHRALVSSVATLIRLGYPCDVEYLTGQARLMHQVAVQDLDMMETHPTEAEQVETAVASAVLYEPLLMSLRRMAQEEESARRYGI
ncbi:transcriptional regulator, partial [Streptomyces sp. NPDC088178]